MKPLFRFHYQNKGVSNNNNNNKQNKTNNIYTVKVRRLDDVEEINISDDSRNFYPNVMFSFGFKPLFPMEFFSGGGSI